MLHVGAVVLPCILPRQNTRDSLHARGSASTRGCVTLKEEEDVCVARERFEETV
jgi:hypothetical protein